MSLSRSESRAVAARYVSAMFDLALQQKAVDVVGKDLLALKSAIADSPELAKLIQNPVIDSESKARAFAAILQKLGANKITIQQVEFVIRNKRVEVLTDIADLFKDKMITHRGERQVEIISSKPLNNNQIRDIAASLGTALGQSVNLTTKVDPSILGGLIIKLGSRMLDQSVAGRLRKLNAALKSSAAA